MKKVVVIDAQGGGIGRQIVTEIRNRKLPVELLAIGANSAAAAQMLKAGADHSAAGENPVLVACRTADFIIGPIGIILADAMYGEITPKMSCAIGQSSAQKLLIPVNHCSCYVAGVSELNMKKLIQDVIDRLEGMLSDRSC